MGVYRKLTFQGPVHDIDLDRFPIRSHLHSVHREREVIRHGGTLKTLKKIVFLDINDIKRRICMVNSVYAVSNNIVRLYSETIYELSASKASSLSKKAG